MPRAQIPARRSGPGPSRPPRGFVRPAVSGTLRLAVPASSAKNFPVSWEQLHRDAKALAWRLAELGPWTRVIAVSRGGMVPACVVARELEVRLVDTVCAVSYDHMAQGKLRILKAPEDTDAPAGGRGSGSGSEAGRTVVVDDLADTGKTIAALRERYPRAHYATVYVKPAGQPMVDTFVTEVSQDTWIHLPWDLELRFATPLAKAQADGC